MRLGAEGGTLVCVESTSNQVNQFGGYTGQTPEQFAAFVRSIAEQAGLPAERLLLGGDHLGPYPWRKEPAETALEKACELVRQYVQAGYSKVHLDASMACGGDPPGALDEKVVARRSALLCQAAEEAHRRLPSGSPAPLYVAGTEVPVPGGEQAAAQGLSVTRPEDAQRTLDHAQAAFAERGLEEAWDRVIGLVVQPGVEFGDAVVFEYDRSKALCLGSRLPSRPELVYEAHSTDYQTPGALREMVQDHFAILKVGPWLTFAFREGVFALSAIEQEWLGGRRGARISRVREALERAMLANPIHWQPYYQGDEQQVRLARMYSYSDRCRYYWPEPSLQAELDLLVANLSTSKPPLTLLSQYLPEQYAAVRAGALANAPGDLLRDRIRGVLRIYAAACGDGGELSPLTH
jgi:D-tagatose-1,6-bisphosphate aldolase subunit GatZ/KbaZ